MNAATVTLGLIAMAIAPVMHTEMRGTTATPTSFRVQVVGKGRPMILIPGLMSSGETWNSTVARYQDRFECHVLTLAGFAGVPPITTPLLATVRTELADYIRGQQLDRPVIVGHSLGGGSQISAKSRS